jgi:hypothetical protein
VSSSLPDLVVPARYLPSGSLNVVVDAAPSASDPKLSFVGEMLDDFVQAGSFGGYAHPTAEPERSNLIMHSSSSVQGGLQYRLQSDSIDLRAFQVLRNMIARLQLDDIFATRLVVSDTLTGDSKKITLPIPDEDNEDDVYPSVPARPAFNIELDDIGPGRARRCVVECANPVEADQVLELERRVDSWFALLEDGGFALPIGHPAEEDCLRGAVCQFDEFSTEISVLCFRASEEAWNVLINILTAYSKLVAPVTSVVIE